MITHALQFTLFVKDLEVAKEFYTKKLGFVVRHDMEFSPGWRFLTVAPQKDSETVIELAKADSPEREALIGKQAANQVLLMFATDDIEKDYREMKARGVVFHGEPKAVPGGKGVAFEDLYGNLLDMYQIQN
jgi:predicted enzyme related to lactoylglutathione lyase